MDKSARELFVRLLETPSPSGYEREIQDVVRAFVADFADEVRTDSHGNVIAALNPDAPLRLLLAGHCDQIGLLVSHIDDRGFLYTQAEYVPQFDAGGAVTQTAAINASGLELLGACATYTLTHACNDVDNIAADTGGFINFVDKDCLNVGTVCTVGPSLPLFLKQYSNILLNT